MTGLLPQPGLLFTLASFIAMIAVLVVVHEGGHYLAGRFFGARVDSFAVGFGRELLGWTDRRGVRWRVNAIPLGGYVKFTGDMNAASQTDPELMKLSPQERAGLFAFLPVWQRAIIVAAGPAINFVFAILILAGFNMALGHPSTPPVVGQVLPGSAAAKAGIRAGDRILTLDGRPMARFEEVLNEILTGTGTPLVVGIERDGRRQDVLVRPAMIEVTDRFGNRSRVPRLGIARPEQVIERVGPVDAVGLALTDTFEITRTIGRTLQQIVLGQRDLAEMGGPVRTAQVVGQQASMGLVAAISFMAFFSINLGFINLLPIPMLDGGHLLLYAIEAARRRPVAEAIQKWAFMSGFAALMSLMLVLTWQDIGAVGLWDRLAGWLG